MSDLLTNAFIDILDTAVTTNDVAPDDYNTLAVMAYGVLAERDSCQPNPFNASIMENNLYPIATIIAQKFEKLIGDNPIPNDFYNPIAFLLIPVTHAR